MTHFFSFHLKEKSQKVIFTYSKQMHFFSSLFFSFYIFTTFNSNIWGLVTRYIWLSFVLFYHSLSMYSIIIHTLASPRRCKVVTKRSGQRWFTSSGYDVAKGAWIRYFSVCLHRQSLFIYRQRALRNITPTPHN